MPIIAPSILNCDFADLRSEIQMLDRSEAEWIHLDVMDGTFVPNLSFGAPIVKVVDGLSDKFLDAHLMMVNPENYIEDFKNAGAELITVHYEECKYRLQDTINKIKVAGCKVGIALNPESSPEFIEPFIDQLDLVLVMSVHPGFGGQKFIESAYDKVALLRKMIDTRESKALIQVDGGVNIEIARKLVDVGADVLVAGSLVFRSDDPEGIIAQLKGSKVNA